jgi:hypothetical protein
MPVQAGRSRTEHKARPRDRRTLAVTNTEVTRAKTVVGSVWASWVTSAWVSATARLVSFGRNGVGDRSHREEGRDVEAALVVAQIPLNLSSAAAGVMRNRPESQNPSPTSGSRPPG